MPFGLGFFAAAGSAAQFIMALAGGYNSSANKLIRSGDSVTWTDISTSFGQPYGIDAMSYGNNTFVVIANSQTTNGLATSTDAVTWSYSTAPGSSNGGQLTFGNGLFLLSTGSGTTVFTSPNGITWTSRASALQSSASPYGATYGGGFYVVCGLFGTISSSTDGVTFTSRLRTNGNGFTRAAYKSNVWLVGGGDGIWRSTDGISFSQVSSLGGNALAAGSSLFIRGQNGGGLYTSPDGNTWTSRTSGFGSTNIRAASFSNGLYIIGGGGSFTGGGKLGTSPDGITWTLRTSGFGTGGDDKIEAITSTTWAQA